MQTWPLPQSVSAVQVRAAENLQVPVSHFSANGQLLVYEHVMFEAAFVEDTLTRTMEVLRPRAGS